MNQCHECGNELTEVDAFCPFCGIALAPSIVEEEVESTSAESTDDGTAIDEINESENDFADSESVLVDDEPEMEEPDALPEVNSEASDAAGFVDSSNLLEKSSASDESGESSEKVSSQDLSEPDVENDPEIPLDVEASSDKNTEDASEVPAELEGASEPVLDGVDVMDPPEDKSQQIEATSADPGGDEGFLEDSTIMMSSFPVIESEDVEEETPETSSDPEIVNTENVDTGSDKPDLEGETIIVKSGSLDLPPDAAAENQKAAGDSIDEDVLSKTIGYVPSDLEDLKHIDASDLDLNDKNDELAAEDDISQIRDGSTRAAEDESLPLSELDDGAVDAVGAIPVLDETGGASSDELVPGAVNVSHADENPFEQASSVEDEPVHSETTPNIGVEDTDGSNKKKLKPLNEGTVLNNRYEIIRKIGGGGMGAVYLANDKNLGGVLRAVKEMVQSYIEEEQQDKAINDFKRESMLLTSLDHSSIPTIYDYFYDETEGRFYLVMKYISGGDLSGKIRSAPEGRIDEKSVVEWGSQIADVLDYLHNRQPPIVYRDLKPANVMVDGNSGRVMLIDFGIARWVNKEEKGVTAVGTMGYAPPELFSGNVEPRSDIYSLGSTMFHLLTGADPQSNPLLIFDFQKHPRPRQINPALSDQIEKILMRAVEYSAEKRFSSAAEMRDALIAHLNRLNSGNASYGIDESPKAVGLSDQPVFCGFCGQKIVATDMFCAFCGAKQPLAQPGVHAEEYAPVGVNVKLLVEGTSDLEAPAFSLVKDDNLLGRRDPISDIFPEVDLSKFDPQTKISRKHARIWRDGNKFMLEDLNSSNGTLLTSPRSDSVRLSPHESHVLTNGDKIQMGDTILHFLVG